MRFLWQLNLFLLLIPSKKSSAAAPRPSRPADGAPGPDSFHHAPQEAGREGKAIQDREKLVVGMLPLVKRVALKIRERLPAEVEMDDLVSDGVLGLVDAVAKFNPRKRVKLESYARHRIRGSILDGLRGADPVPRDLRHKQKCLQKLYHELEAKLGRSVKDEEMAAGLGMTVAQWHHELNEIQACAAADCGARALSAGPTSVPSSAEPAFLAGDESEPFRPCFRREQSDILFSRPFSTGGARAADHRPLLPMRTDDAGDCQSYEGRRIAGFAASCSGSGP